MATMAFKLPKEQVAKLRESQRELMDILPEFDKAAECGIECSELKAARDEAVQKIEALLKHYA
jgi:hypothetical protein